MDHETRSRHQRERDAYLDDIEKAHFFDIDSGIYKPKSCQSTTSSNEEKPGASNRTPLFFNAIPDSFTLTVGLLSFFTLFVTFLAVVWYASVAEQQRVEMHNATVETGIAADAAKEQTILLRKQLEGTAQAILQSDLMLSDTGFQITFTNIGRETARKITGETIISLRAAPSGTTIKDRHIPIEVPNIPASPLTRNFQANIKQWKSGYRLSEEEWLKFRRGEAAIVVNITFGYDNGFEHISDKNCSVRMGIEPVIKQMSAGSTQSSGGYFNLGCESLPQSLESLQGMAKDAEKLKH